MRRSRQNIFALPVEIRMRCSELYWLEKIDTDQQKTKWPPFCGIYEFLPSFFGC